jgi:hypothetical protein
VVGCSTAYSEIEGLNLGAARLQEKIAEEKVMTCKKVVILSFLVLSKVVDKNNVYCFHWLMTIAQW